MGCVIDGCVARDGTEAQEVGVGVKNREEDREGVLGMLV